MSPQLEAYTSNGHYFDLQVQIKLFNCRRFPLPAVDPEEYRREH